MAAPDRRAALLVQTRVTGLDFVYVFPSQTQLDVHFLLSPATVKPSLVDDLPKERVTIESTAGLPDVGVEHVTWPTVAGERVLRITTPTPTVWPSASRPGVTALWTAGRGPMSARRRRSWTTRSTTSRATSGASAARCSTSHPTAIRTGRSGSRRTPA
jgi:hypothetical protein